jgi:demethylmenaquinone methyltransferase / 2-methoxy-6-polyprenyl-1,4-benzoquinol methylase
VSQARIDKGPAAVSAMFDGIAERYDLLNDVLSLGQDRWWRRAVAAAVAAGPGERVLDLAAGTGTSSATFTTSGAACVACDFSLGMLRVGAQRTARGGLRGVAPPRQHRGGLRGVAPPRQHSSGRVAFVAGDALRLPFRDASFDAVTISFGLRNVADPRAALAEMLRVTRPGGRLVICEFSHLRWRRLDALYGRYLAAVLPAVARGFMRSAGAYTYLARSIRDWPAQAELARQIGEAGWSAVRWRDLTLGVVTVHAARRRKS